MEGTLGASLPFNNGYQMPIGYQETGQHMFSMSHKAAILEHITEEESRLEAMQQNSRSLAAKTTANTTDAPNFYFN